MSDAKREPPITLDEAYKLAVLCDQQEALLRVQAAQLKLALKIMQAARNLLATLTPEGDVERLAAKKLAELLGPSEAEHG